MARGINKVILVGNLGNDPEVRYAQSGSAITTISVATSESWKDKDGNPQERTEWHRVKFFGKLAEIAGEYLKKGSQVYIEGSLRTEKYTDKSGVEKYSTDIVANEMQMLGGKPGMGGEGGGERPTRSAGGGYGNRGAAASGGTQTSRGSGGSGGPAASGGGGYGNRSAPPAQSNDPFPDDDIPF